MKPLLKPFKGLRPTAEFVAQVIAPPYDVLNSAEARQRAQNKPWSILHISKPEIDLPLGTDPYDPAVYTKGAENFARMIKAGVLKQDPAAYYYIYRLTMGQHQQTGIVAVASVEAYQQQRICKHEQTQPAKVNDRIQQIKALNAQTGPVLLACHAQTDLDLLLQQLTTATPALDAIADDNVRHQLWVVKDPAIITQLTALFENNGNLYIADGHHRSEAAAQLANATSPASEYFLAVIFPEQQLQILSYNRVVKDLNGFSATDFLQELQQDFVVEKKSTPVAPAQMHEFGMYLKSQWYLLTLRNANNLTDAVATLDVSLLAQHILEPILNIHDPRRDPRIEFVGGIRGLTELEKRVNSGEMAVAFSLFPTQMKSIMKVADQHQNMPPKSTWFEPKLADGLVSYLLED